MNKYINIDGLRTTVAIIKCDRCGANINCTDVTKMKINGCNLEVNIYFDLCPNCNKELAKWLNEKQEEEE